MSTSSSSPYSARRHSGTSTTAGTTTALTVAGRVDTVRDGSGERLFRHRSGPGHHRYLICRQCGHSLVVEAGPVERWARRIAVRSGFSDVRHTVELSGTCPACTARPEHSPGTPEFS